MIGPVNLASALRVSIDTAVQPCEVRKVGLMVPKILPRVVNILSVEMLGLVDAAGPSMWSRRLALIDALESIAIETAKGG